MHSRFPRILGSAACLAAFLLIIVSISVAQGDSATQAIGLPPHGSFDGSDFDTVQLNNGNLHIEIPLYSMGGRGLSVPVSLVYDSKGWCEYTTNPIQGTEVDVYPRDICPSGGAENMAWTLAAPLSNGLGDETTNQIFSCTAGRITTVKRVYREPNGTAHNFPQTALPGNVCNFYSPQYGLALDGTGYTFQYNSSGPVYITKNGTRVFSTVDGQGKINAWVMEDTNGNQITRAVSNGVGASTVTDTLGRSIGMVMTLNSGTGKYELKYYDSNGNQQTIQITMTTVNLHTGLCPYQHTGSDGPCVEYVGSWQAPSVIQLPNGMQYTITYVQSSHGQISSIQLPSGGTISYTWGNPTCHCPDADDAGVKVKSRVVTSNGATATWSYAYTGGPTGSGTTTVTDPYVNDTVHTFNNQGDTGFYSRGYDVTDQYYQGSSSSGTLLKTVQTDYQASTQGPHLPIHVTTTWNQQGALISRAETDYYNLPNPPTYAGPPLSWGNITETREYGFGTGTFGALARKTDYQYAHISGDTGYNSNYASLGIDNLLTQRTVYDGSSNKMSDAKTVYDGVGLTTTSGVPNHDYSIGTYRGNPTQSSVWVDSTNSWLNTNNTYSDLGHVLSTTDPGTHTTTFSYLDSWITTGVVYNCAVGTNTQAYLTQTSAPNTTNSQGATVQHRLQKSYFPCTGQTGSARDENDILAGRNGTAYTYDLMLRPSTVTQTDGGETSYSYTDTANAVSVTTTEKQDPTPHNIVNTSYHDGLDRVKQTQLVDPADGDTFVDTTYDLLSRVSTVSNPHRSASLPTDGITTYQYDALSRKTLEIPPDGTSSSNNVQTSYGAQTTSPLPIGLTTTVTDQAGHKRMSVTDALGRTVDVWEPDPSSGSLVNETLYTYNARDNLVQVDQKGNTTDSTQWRTRTFTYDSLSRLLTATNPESGKITWTYDVDSNVLTKADARTNTITYNYDQLHRVATTPNPTVHAKTYSNNDPPVDYYFDQTSYNGLTIAEGVNHRTGMADMTGAAAWTFDTEGRTLVEQRKVNISGLTPSPVTKALTYVYNLDGSMKSLTYPTGHQVLYTYTIAGQTNTAGRARSAIDSTGTTINYVTAATYAPPGEVGSYTNGQTSGFTGISTTNAWNDRLQPTSFNAATMGSGAHTVQSLTFNFNQGTQTAPIDNGLLVKVTNGVNSGRTTNYKYDQLNRIVAAWHDATDWGTQYTIDIWGNLSQKAPCNNTAPWYCPTHTMGDSFSTTFTGTLGKKNQMDTYNYYDANGNLTNDLLGHSFSYDSENRPSTAGGVTYYYDGESERVAKSSGKLYLFGTNSTPVVETDTSGNMTAEYVFFNGKRVAMRKADSSVHYYFADQVGSADVVTNATGAMPPEQDIEYHPYGEQQVYTDTLGQQYRFTGHEHDTETNDDYFGARYYSSGFGRFLTPDWAATPVPIPYAVMGNPQTLNLYSYVENNPITGTDPDGHCCDFNDATNFAAGAFNAFTSDNLFGANRQTQTTTAGKLGAAVGDFAATATGTLEFLGGGGEALLTSPAAATGPGILIPAAGAAVATHGASAATLGFSNLFMSVNSEAGAGNTATSDKGSGGNTESTAETERAAHREAMRQEGIPTSQQPKSQKMTKAGRQYTYETPEGEKLVQRNTGTDRSHPGQPHVEAGKPKPAGQTDSIGRPRLQNDKTKVVVKPKNNGQ
jgi:RHS repeat-associated protein